MKEAGEVRRRWESYSYEGPSVNQDIGAPDKEVEPFWMVFAKEWQRSGGAYLPHGSLMDPEYDGDTKDARS